MKRTYVILIGSMLGFLVAPVMIYTQGYAAENVQREYWTCPMHPQIHSDAPGSCPMCGMDLVRKVVEKKTKLQLEASPLPEKNKKNTIPDGHAAFNLSLERQQMIGVKTGKVEKGPVVKKIESVGRVAFDPELYTAQNDLVEALNNFENLKHSPIREAVSSAAQMVESARFRLKVLGVSQVEIAKIEKSRKKDSSLLVGNPGKKAWIYAEIFEDDLPSVKPGQEVEITASFLKSQKFAAKISSVDTNVDPGTRTTKARIFLASAPAGLRSRSYVNVRILVPLGERVSVPFDAVFDTGNQAWAFITDGKGNFEPRLIQIESYVDGKAILSAGLIGGETIVTSANFLIDSESRLRSVSEQPNLPTCPEGQSWDLGMSMCM